MKKENEIEHFEVRRRIGELARAFETAKAELVGALFEHDNGADVNAIIEQGTYGTWVGDQYDGKMTPPSDQQKRDAEYWVMVKKQYRDDNKVSLVTENSCPDCGASVEWDGEQESDGCEQDWATFQHWSTWCVGAVHRDDVDCDCDLSVREADHKVKYAIASTHRAWETLKDQHPERTWVEPTMKNHGDGGHQGHYLWPANVEAEFAASEPTRPHHSNYWGISLDHAQECRKTQSKCGWSNSGSDLVNSGGRY